MPVSAKMRAAQGKMRTARRRTARGSTMASINRSVGFNRSRQLVSIPAALRARSMAAGTELKAVDSSVRLTEAGGSPIAMLNVAGGVTPFLMFNHPIEGSSFYNRIGRRTRAVSLEVRGFVNQTGANTARPVGYGRIMIIYDRQSNGAVPAVSDILLDYNSQGTSSTYATSGPNMDNRDRFLVLRDRKFILPAIGLNGIAPSLTSPTYVVGNADMKDSLFNFTEYIKLNGLETQYKASTSGAIGDVATGAFIILAMDSHDGTGAAAYQLNYTSRFKFYD